MEKKIVFSCSCFIDQSFWFVNSMYHSWKFDSFACVNGSVSNNLFIYEKEFTFVSDFDGNNVQYINEIIVCCLECFEFLLTYFSTEEEIVGVFNKIDCLYVIEEPFCYNSEIYIGNDQFVFSNENQGQIQPYNSTKKRLEKYFKKQPETKSCFTSIEKYSYECFCSSCKRIFKILFMGKLFRIEK